ncbi:hypothetical protein CP10743SC13_2176, partial [Chlamydia psittaci 10_743_SC13]
MCLCSLKYCPQTTFLVKGKSYNKQTNNKPTTLSNLHQIYIRTLEALQENLSANREKMQSNIF